MRRQGRRVCGMAHLRVKRAARKENKIMTVTRAIAVTAILTGLAVSAAGSAWADPQNPNTNQMSGHYIRTDTSSTGQTVDSDWYFTPCGDGCASLAFTPGGPAKAQAQLVSGQWTMDVADTPAACSDGSKSARRLRRPLLVGCKHARRHRTSHLQAGSLRSPTGRDVHPHYPVEAGTLIPAGYTRLDNIELRQAA
jgi:hypothetical protein